MVLSACTAPEPNQTPGSTATTVAATATVQAAATYTATPNVYCPATSTYRKVVKHHRHARAKALSCTSNFRPGVNNIDNIFTMIPRPGFPPGWSLRACDWGNAPSFVPTKATKS